MRIEMAPATIRYPADGLIDKHSLLDVAVIIPALNEEAGLAFVLAELPAVGQVIVADNGSTDRTAEVARQFGATVVREPRRGYGAACLAALAEVARLSELAGVAPKAIVFLDADHSDFPQAVPELAAPVLQNECDLVIGSRVMGEREQGAMSTHSLAGTRFACFLMRQFMGIPCTDLGPFRAIGYSSLCRLGMSDRGMGWTTEMQIKAARKGLRVREVPVPYRRRIGQSKISGTWIGSARAGAKILWTIARHAWQRGNKR